MMTATNLLSELAHALRRSIGDNGDQETSNQQNTNDPNTMEKTKEVSTNMGFQSAVKKWLSFRQVEHGISSFFAPILLTYLK